LSRSGPHQTLRNKSGNVEFVHLFKGTVPTEYSQTETEVEKANSPYGNQIMFPSPPNMKHKKWVPVTTARRVLSFWTEERPPIWKVGANILNKQSRTAEGGSHPALGLGDMLTAPHHKNVSCYEPFTKAPDPH